MLNSLRSFGESKVAQHRMKIIKLSEVYEEAARKEALWGRTEGDQWVEEVEAMGWESRRIGSSVEPYSKATLFMRALQGHWLYQGSFFRSIPVWVKRR